MFGVSPSEGEEKGTGRKINTINVQDGWGELIALINPTMHCSKQPSAISKN
jgi:hypothetical protein